MLYHNNKDDKEAAALKRAEDVAYTLNHSLYCTLTDFLNPPINAATDNMLRWLIPGCGHDHSKDGGHHHHGPGCAHGHAPAVAETRWNRFKNASRQTFSKDRFVQYAKGEFIGDFAAVPLTIGMQRYLPGVMDGLRQLAEPVMGPLFRKGVALDSKRWAKRQGLAVESEAYRAHVEEVYQHEMSHLPQAIVWTGFSLGLNTAYQMHVDKSAIPFMQKLALKSSSVLSGVAVTAGMVVAARALAPHRVRNFDQWTSGHVILPATKTVGKVFGWDGETVERMHEEVRRDHDDNWTQRVQPGAQRGTERS